MYIGNAHPEKGLERLFYRLRPWRKPDSIGVQEVGITAGRLGNLKGYSTFYKRNGNVYQRSNAILVKNSHRILGWTWIPAARGVENVSTAPERNIVIVRYEKKYRFRKKYLKIAHINTHFHVVPEDELRGVGQDDWPRVATQYAEHAKLLTKKINDLHENGFVVFVTCDGNARRLEGRDWYWSAHLAAERGNLTVVQNGVDFAAFSHGRLRLVGKKVIDKSVTDSDDHDSITIKVTT